MLFCSWAAVLINRSKVDEVFGFQRKNEPKPALPHNLPKPGKKSASTGIADRAKRISNTHEFDRVVLSAVA